MNKFILSVIIGMLAGSQISFAQSSDPFEVQSRLYKMALKNYDLPAATNAVYNMLALKPERTDLSDSLALLYFASERYPQAYLVGEEILKADPKRNDILEIVAVSKQNLGLIKEALADYEKLYASQKNIFYLYQMATLQYQLKRYGECIASLDQIIGNADSEKQKVNIRVQGGTQDVPMKAAALNVKGICALELKQESVAKDNFEQALKIFPDFVLAKGNLDAANKKDGGAKTPGTGTTGPKTSVPPKK